MKRVVKPVLMYLCVISLLISTGCGEQSSATASGPLYSVLMVDDTLYYSTEKEILVEIDESEFLGNITSTEDNTMMPTENGQANMVFESPPYAKYNGGIVIRMDGKWILFESLESGFDPSITHPTNLYDEEVNSFEGVIMAVVEGSVTTTQVNVTLLNESDLNVTYGSDFALQKFEDGRWYSISHIIGNGMFNAIGYTLVKDKPTTVSIDWEWLYGVLPAGKYRIVKGALDSRAPGDFDEYYLAAEFTIDDSQRKE